MNEHDIVGALRNPSSSAWIDAVAARIVECAARSTPRALSGRLKEEWFADLWERPGPMSRLRFALGCLWAATVISHDHGATGVAATSSGTSHTTLVAYAPYRGSVLRATAQTPDAVLCDINITPLIDVMLVLLVTLIVSLPAMTHAVKLDLPQSLPTHEPVTPEVIDVDVDFDGTVVWNGMAIASLEQLDGYFHTEARKNPQPEIHLRPDRHAKYDVVARVLASAQRNRMRKIGIANTGQFSD